MFFIPTPPETLAPASSSAQSRSVGFSRASPQSRPCCPCFPWTLPVPRVLPVADPTIAATIRRGDVRVRTRSTSPRRPFGFRLALRLQERGIKTVLLSGDREEAVAGIGKMVGIGRKGIKASLTPQQKSSTISGFQAEGHRVAMIGDGINNAPSLALADVGVALQIEAKENAASDAASVILLGNRLSQIVDALSLAQATMTKVRQNLAWAVTYNVVAIPIAGGLLLPQFDFAMTPSLSGGLMAMSSVFVVTNSLLLKLHKSSTGREQQ